MPQIAALLSELEDPFQMFPLRAVARTLAESVADSETYLAEQAGWWGVSARYRTVDEEHAREVISLLIGSAFVLGQTAITQAVAIVTKLRGLAGQPSWLPSDKAEVLNTEATIHRDTGLSEVVLFDAVANYFKHRHEWPSDWGRSSAQGPQRRTIEVVHCLGLSPEADDNLGIALHKLGFRTTGVGSLGDRIQAWRERLAENLRKNLHDHDLG